MRHMCHWPSCRRIIPVKLFMCTPHWKQLPQVHRDAIFKAYRVGQEIDKNPSREYVTAARSAQEWARDQEFKLRARVV